MNFMYIFEIIQKNNYLNLLIIIMKNIIHFLKYIHFTNTHYHGIKNLILFLVKIL